MSTRNRNNRGQTQADKNARQQDGHQKQTDKNVRDRQPKKNNQKHGQEQRQNAAKPAQLQGEPVAHKLSVGGPVCMGAGDVARLVGNFLHNMVVKVYGLGRLGGFSITTQTPGEAKLSVVIRPTAKHAANGQGGYTQTVAARKPNLFTLITRDEGGNGWSLHIDRRANLDNVWNAAALYELTALLFQQSRRGTFVGALAMPGSDNTEYRSVRFTRNLIKAVGQAVAMNATQDELTKLVQMANVADQQGTNLKLEKVTSETLATTTEQGTLPLTTAARSQATTQM